MLLLEYVNIFYGCHIIQIMFLGRRRLQIQGSAFQLTALPRQHLHRIHRQEISLSYGDLQITAQILSSLSPPGQGTGKSIV